MVGAGLRPAPTWYASRQITGTITRKSTGRLSRKRIGMLSRKNPGLLFDTRNDEGTNNLPFFADFVRGFFIINYPYAGENSVGGCFLQIKQPAPQRGWMVQVVRLLRCDSAWRSIKGWLHLYDRTNVLVCQWGKRGENRRSGNQGTGDGDGK